MEALKERIRKEGKVLPGNIIKVDGFLNHRVDCQFMAELADEFAKYFDMSKVDVVLTAEASGIALAAICAYRYNKPLVFAKKAKSDNIEGGLYCSEIVSYTYRKKVTLIVSKECSIPETACSSSTIFLHAARPCAACARSWRKRAVSWSALAAPLRRASSTAATSAVRQASISSLSPFWKRRSRAASSSARTEP